VNLIDQLEPVSVSTFETGEFQDKSIVLSTAGPSFLEDNPDILRMAEYYVQVPKENAVHYVGEIFRQRHQNQKENLGLVQPHIFAAVLNLNLVFNQSIEDRQAY